MFAGTGHLVRAKYTLNREVVTTPVESGQRERDQRISDDVRLPVHGLARGRLAREATSDGDSRWRHPTGMRRGVAGRIERQEGQLLPRRRPLGAVPLAGPQFQLGLPSLSRNVTVSFPCLIWRAKIASFRWNTKVFPADIDLVSWRENHVEHIGKPRRREVSIPP